MSGRKPGRPRKDAVQAASPKPSKSSPRPKPSANGSKAAAKRPRADSKTNDDTASPSKKARRNSTSTQKANESEGDFTFKTAFVTGGSGFVGRALIERLVSDGVAVRALARSAEAAKTVSDLGATAIHGDCSDLKALAKGCKGADIVFHLAAKVSLDGPWEEYQRDTVDGTRNVIEAAEGAGVKAFVNCGTEALILGEGPLHMADETRGSGVKAFVNCGTEALILGEGPLHMADETGPYSKTPAGPYSKSKGLAEDICLKANKPGFRVVSIRPRFVWGKGDTVLGPAFAKSVQSGAFMWVGGGANKTSTTNIDNVIEGLLCGAARGRGGEAYFVTDGEPHTLKDFVTTYTKKFGADPSNCWSVPSFIGTAASWLGKLPPYAMDFFFQEVTLSDAKARREIGYEGKVTFEEGLKRMGTPTPTSGHSFY